jgi:hypothetical protein
MNIYISPEINKILPNSATFPYPPCNNKVEMRTERQIEASRVNGAKSRGPVTAEGKWNSSRNSTRHGMLAESVVLEGESQERFLELLAEIDGELQPETPVEHALVQKMAVAQWRQFRLWTLEKTAIDHLIRKQAQTVGCNEHKATCASLAFRTLADESRSLDLFHRYDSLCDRQYLRAHKRFLELRRGRGDSPAPTSSKLKPEVPPAPEASTPETHVPEDFDLQTAWDPFVPEPPVRGKPTADGKPNEKQPNEPNNSLETLESGAANPTPEIGQNSPSKRKLANDLRWNMPRRAVFCPPDQPVTLMLKIGRGPLYR